MIRLTRFLSMVSVCLPSDALLQHLPTYLGFSYLERGVSLHGCSSKAQPLLLTLDEGYLLTAAVPDLQCGIAPLGPPVRNLLDYKAWDRKESDMTEQLSTAQHTAQSSVPGSVCFYFMKTDSQNRGSLCHDCNLIT